MAGSLSPSTGSTRNSSHRSPRRSALDRPIAVTLRLGDERFGEQAILAADAGNGNGNGDAALTAAARSLLEIGESAIVESGLGEKIFVESYAPRANLYLFGASDHVAALVPLGKQLGYRVTVCDPRKVFLTRERFRTPTSSPTSGPTSSSGTLPSTPGPRSA